MKCLFAISFIANDIKAADYCAAMVRLMEVCNFLNSFINVI